MQNKQILAGAFVVLVLCGFGWISVSSGQAPSGQSDGQTVKALLDEVRLLRLAMQRNGVATYRAQITLERLKLQQARVDELLKEQAELRSRIKDFEQNLPNLTGQLTELEKMVALATTPSERNEREMMIRRVNDAIEREKRQIQELREREPQVAARVQTEQAKLAELNESLDKLERELETAATDKGKRP